MRAAGGTAARWLDRQRAAWIAVAAFALIVAVRLGVGAILGI